MLYTFSVFVFPQEIRRIDVYLASIFKDVSRSFVQRLIEKEYVKCNGKNADKNFKLRRGDVIEVHFVTEKMDVEAEDLPLEVIFENEEFAVVSKDAGVNTHPVPGVGGNSGTLVNALLHRFGGLSVIGGVERPGIVHRLDKDTSGLLVIAKSDRSMAQLQKRMNDRTIEKHYLALVVGVPSEASGFIESYIGRDRHDRKKMTADNPINPKLAKTRFRVVSTSVDGRYALLDIELLTGRTHQIRVHLSGIGFPIVWDAVYGRKHVNKLLNQKAGLWRQWLHARTLRFSFDGKDFGFCAPLKSDLERTLKTLGIPFEDETCRVS